MADDIDIEEHDLMDNPAIKDVFPDISALKEEIKLFAQGVHQLVEGDNCTEKKEENTDEKINDDPGPVINSSLSDDVVIIEDDPNEVTSQDTAFSNKIILGSKPTKIFEFEEDFFEENVKSYEVSIVLDDLKPYLDTSERYCNVCLILFPQRHDLETHIHTFHIATKEKNDNIIHKSKIFLCKICNMQFNCNSSLYRHKKIQHNKMPTMQGIEEMISNVENNLLDNVHPDPEKPNENVCFHCQQAFHSQQSLIEHLYDILQSKQYSCKDCSKCFTSSEELTKHTITHKKCLIVLEKVPDQPEHTYHKSKSTKSIQQKPIQEDISKTALSHLGDEETEMFSSDELKYYRCFICSYYFTRVNFYVAHLANKHKIVKDCKDSVKDTFCGKCKFCSSTCSIKSYNIHLLKNHKDQVNKIVEQHTYLEAQNEKLNQDTKNKKVNSKDINKRLNEPIAGPSSERNKLTSRAAKVKNSGVERIIVPLAFESVLFKCSKCDVHFLSSKVAKNHTEHIEMLINWKCLLCKNIFKNADKVLHEEQHKYCNKFTVHDLCPIASTPVLYKCHKCAVHFNEDNFFKHFSICESETPNSVFCIICDILIDNSVSKTHRSEHISRNLKPTDFVIVSNSDVLVKSSIKAKSKILETEKSSISSSISKNHTLKRKVYESSNIPQKRPNNSDILLKLNYCNSCKCFLTDSDKLEVHFKEHCHQLQKHICTICGLTLTEESYTRVHGNLHSTNSNMKLKDFRFYDLKSGKQISPPVPKFSKCENCNVHLIPDGEHNCLQTDFLTCHICKINLTEHAFKLHMQFHSYSVLNRVNSTELDDDSIKANTNSVIVNKNSMKISKNGQNTSKEEIGSDNVNKSHRSNNTRQIKTAGKMSNYYTTKNNIGSNKPTHSQSVDKNELVTEMNSTKQINLDEVLYQCLNCRVFVDTYTRVIEHCHDHFCNEEDLLETSKCQICNITLEKSCFEHHESLHVSHTNKENFTFLDFDPFYFASDNSIWTEHVFGTLSSNQRDIIINDTIYKFECRVKMEVIQNGPANLTVYKCDKCRSFIDGGGLYKHAENSCFKLRKHPCSVCGLGFNSSMARTDHEKVHKEPNITLKSYRIVTFNKDEDKAFNKLLFKRSQYHVLYQCRNCSQAVDKSQTKNHECHGQSIKSCSMCGLLIANDDYDYHLLRHDMLPNFIPKHIKIILFGEPIENSGSDDINDKNSSFTGLIYDYTFYSCTKCEVCMKPNVKEKHICCFGTNRLKCSICKLYFATSRLKQHIKLHETDPDFLRNNMRIIELNTPDEISSESTDVETTPKEPFEASADETPIEISPEIELKSAMIYKCLCGLHFLTASDVISHFKVCEQKSRAARQQCTKCNLLFTSDVLFNHLILHHGKKSQIYKFDIVDLAMNNIIYRCTKCKLHFANVQDINRHLKQDCGTTEGKDCIFCHLKFESCSFQAHDCNNVENVNAGIKILDLDEPLVSRTTAAREAKLETLKKIDNTKSECETTEETENITKGINSEHSPTIETSQEKLPDEQSGQMKMIRNNESKDESSHCNIEWETMDIEVPSSTIEINVSDALAQPEQSSSIEKCEEEPVNNQPVQVCITTSSTQSIDNETQKPTANLETAKDTVRENYKHRQSQRPYNSGRPMNHQYKNHNQYQNHNNMRTPRPWQNNQNRWQHSRGTYRPRGQMQQIRSGPQNHQHNQYPPNHQHNQYPPNNQHNQYPPNHQHNQYQNPQNRFYDYPRNY